VAGALRWNLAHRSLWWDEVWQLKNASHGEFKPSKDDPEALRFSPATWARCAWYYQKPTNHVPSALASKASLSAWRAATGAPREAFYDFAVRLPTFLVSLVSVVAIGVLARDWAGPAAGLAAAVLLAVHPWHVRYGIDTRAFSYLVLWVTLVALALTRASRSGGWVPWLGFGLCQFLLVWSLPNAVWFAAGFFGVAAFLVARWYQGPARLDAWARLVAVNVLAAMLYLQVAGPILLQTSRWIGSYWEPHYLEPIHLLDAAAQLGAGTPLHAGAGPEGEGLASIDTHPQAKWAAMAFAAAAVLGLARLHRLNPTGAWIVLAVIGAAAIYLGATFVLAHLFYPRYLIYLLPVAVALVAVGLTLPGRAGAAAGLVALVVLLWGFTPQLRVLATRPYAPLRDVAEFLAAESANGPLDASGYQLGGSVLQAYYPALDPFGGDPAQARAHLAASMASARATGRRFLVAYGYSDFNRFIAPGGFELLDDPGLFREIAAFAGIEPEFYFRVLEATGQPPPGAPPGRAETPESEARRDAQAVDSQPVAR
jgi:hypothetical protein